MSNAVDDLMRKHLDMFAKSSGDVPLGTEKLNSQPTGMFNLMDASGSMEEYKQITADGLNLFKHRMLMQTENVMMSVRTFASWSVAQDLIINQPIAKVPDVTPENYFGVSGGTALYDAIIEAVRVLESYGYQKNVLTIQTDGQDYDSHHYIGDAAQAVKRARRNGWTILFLGGGVDEYTQRRLTRIADKLGIDPVNVLGYNLTNMKGLEVMGDNIGRMLAGQRSSAGFTEEQRKLAGGITEHMKSIPHENQVRGIKSDSDIRKLLK